MKRYAGILAYDGADFQGFQRQPPPTPTIQAALETAIGRVTGQSARALGAGRTDAGVHALGQVIAFDVEWRHGDAELLRAINSQLPAAIALQRLWQQEGFHPRFDALWRQYAYRVATLDARQPLLNRQAWQLLGQRLDLGRMQAAANCCLGEHDFAAFGTPPQAGSKNTVRRIFRSQWEMESIEFGLIYTYRIRGTAFLYRMVRRLVAAMVQVGSGKISPEQFEQILRSRDIERAKALAPPNGLTLEAVGYASASRSDTSMRESNSVAPEAPLEEKQ